MNRARSLTALAVSLLLTACGGGSGDGSNGSGGNGSGSGNTGGKVTLTGVVAKGLTDNADVAVYAVDATTGQPAATALATAAPTSSGRYTLEFAYSSGAVYVVRAAGRSDATTTHRDEVSGTNQSLPSAFLMRAALRPIGSTDLAMEASITPYSEMAVSAATRASGALTATNVAQGRATVSQLLGFDPQTTRATTVATATTTDERRLAVMLTAVSELAAEGALGCGTAPAGGERTTCVVQALSAASSTSTMALTNGTTNVAAELDAALQTVLADPALVGDVSPGELAVANENLGCTGAACNVTTVNVDNAVDSAITSAKALIANLKTDLLSMFSQGGATSTATGVVNQQAYQFRTASEGVHVPLRTMVTDSGAMLMGIDLYNDWMAGRTTNANRTRGDGDLVANDGAWDYSSMVVPAGCTLFADTGFTTAVTAGQTPVGIGCGARHYFTRSTGFTNVCTQWRHMFQMTPNADGSFSWRSRAQKRTYAGCGSTYTTENPQGSTLYFNGTLAPTLSATYGTIRGFSLSGELPAAWDDDTLVGYRHTLAMNGTVTDGSGGTSTHALTGTLTAYDSTGTVTATVTLKDGSQIVFGPAYQNAAGEEVGPAYAGAVTAGTRAHALALDLMATVGTAEMEGTLALGDVVWDASNRALRPTTGSLSLALRTIASGGARTEFMKGTLSGSISGWRSFNDSLTESTANHYTVTTTFTGNITASARPTLRMIAAASVQADGRNNGDGTLLSSSLQYVTLSNGNAVRTVNFTPTYDGATRKVTQTLITETGSDLRMTLLPGADTADLLNGAGTVIGRYSRDDSRMSFTNGDFVSLDIGL
ncbi:hypothetical protein [Pseudaquabacterium rugosum]|uniref:Carboxypeptidase regulatory-like domain-containing protein n=1 Tax=Pseudaquabacterium rugosum TaxID=2984194 RepID=A0ABU9BAQ1_9BURK